MTIKNKQEENIFMSKTAVIYWSGTGNTEAMAKEVAEGVKSKGAEVTVFEASDFNAGLIPDFDTLIWGCSAQGAEVLEEDVFEPLFDACVDKLEGKKVALFGSYGWGDGEWMRSWEQKCADNCITLAAKSVICNEMPDQDGIAKCRALGESLA